MKQINRSFLGAVFFCAILFCSWTLQSQTIQWLPLPPPQPVPSDPLGANTNGTWILTNLPCYGRVLITQNAPTNVAVSFTGNSEFDNAPNIFGSFNFTETGFGPYSWGTFPGGLGLNYLYQYYQNGNNAALPPYRANFYFLDGMPLYQSLVLQIAGLAEYTTNTVSQPVTFRSEFDLTSSSYTEFNNTYGSSLVSGVTGTVVGSAYPAGGGDDFNTGGALFQTTGPLLTTTLPPGSGTDVNGNTYPATASPVPYLTVTVDHQPGDGFFMTVGYICYKSCSNGCIDILNPPDITVTICSNSAQVDYSVQATDSCCTGCLTLVSTPASGSYFPVGTTTVTSTATDTLGNSNSCTFTVTVIQITNAPEFIDYPPEIVLYTSNCCAVLNDYTFEVSATNGAGGYPTITQSIPPFTTICGNLSTNITFTATDPCGNTNSVTVPLLITNICPTCVLQLPDCTNITVYSCSNVPVYYSPVATDACCSNGPVVCVPASGSFFAPGTTTPVSCSVTDSCGNSNSCTFTVTVASSTNFQVQAPANIMVSSCTNVPVLYPDFTVSNLCCTYKVVYDPPSGTYFAEGKASLVTWSFYGCSGTNILASGSFWVSVYCSNCCTCTNYTNYTVDVFTGSNYLGDWLCQGTNNTLADVLPSVPPGTAVSFWNPGAGQFITPADTFNGVQWHDGTEPLVPGEGFLLVSPTNTNLTIYGCLPGCPGGCQTLSCSSGTLFLAGTGLSPFAFSNFVCGSIPIGTQVEEPPGGGGVSAGLSTFAYSGNGNWVPTQPPDLQVGYAEFIVTPPCPTNVVVIWSNPNGGLWGTLSNWANNVIPNGSGVFVDFSKITLVTNISVILNIPITIGVVTFGDQGNTYSWALTNGGAGPLTLDNGTNIPVINVENQTATITAAIAGTNGLSKGGAGTLVLAGADTYSGPTMVNAGTLQLNQSSLAAGSTVAVAAGGNLDLDFAGTNTVSGLVLNGVGQPPGVYNSVTSPSYISGPGNLLVVLPTGANRANIIVNVSGGVLNLAWSANYTGWRLEMQTNHLAAGISSNPNDWGTVSGSTGTNQVQLPIAPGQPAEYYRLVYP